MFSTTVVIERNLAADPELRFTGRGTAACQGRALASERRQNEAGEWGETEPTAVNFVVFGSSAENLAESARRGTRLVLVGRLRTEVWPDRATGETRTGEKLWVDVVGVSLTYSAAVPRKIDWERARQQSESAAAEPARV